MQDGLLPVAAVSTVAGDRNTDLADDHRMADAAHY
jgi:hypothetical protein